MTSADPAVIDKVIEALDQARSALVALRGGGEVEAVDREWPPDRVDLRDGYWQWMTLQQAAADGPHKVTKLHGLRHHVSKQDGGKRWYSLRRIWQTHGADRPR